ncbi:phospho-sugar mutase [Thermoflexibacter ruber]|uniref:Phosphoglucomutase n=1 Tax=Thermoflexibacter ruber TaxID=1003 RepID=A0A1I2J2Y1_9BACT|nr:phospho-sugar mutase [Thermoflexibacter ruber]SFF47627.1 phosphoglucomutase [Thermoflexibacter ruber]
MDITIQKKIDQWKSGNYDAETKEAISKMSEEELIDSFYKDLEFGTGGLRGLMGVGSNRVNKYTVGAATQGLSNYLKKAFPNEQVKVAVAHDSRNNSPFFASIVADVFSANGFKVYFFESLRPTPELSFAIRHFGCHSGVVLTASHNPKEYNGYKAYWTDGGQVTPPHDKNIIAEVNAITSVEEIKFERMAENIQIIGKEVDEVYLDMICGLSVSKDVIQRQKDLKIVFSPIHGTGITLVPKLLEKMGFTNVHIVQRQATPDGNFPTVVYPNPEEEEAMRIGLEQAKEIDADVLMATDPDADRVGIAVKNHKGEFVLLNGNQTGSLLIGYMIQAWKEAGKITGKEMVVKTIVTSELIDKMAEANGVKCYNTLTGFKYIAEVIKEKEGKETFIAGGEESYGYLIGDAVRDKDAVASCGMIAELVAYAKDKGMSLFDMLIDNYLKYGFYYENLISITKKGKTGAEEIKAMMAEWRRNPPTIINRSKVTKVLDYQESIAKDLIAGTTTPLAFPKSDVLQFYTEDGSKISARPSGTEPKIKFYFSVNTTLKSKADYDATEQVLKERITAIIKDLGL